jgi:hypothetical protein
MQRGRPAEVRYHSLTSDAGYTAEQIASGEAAEIEAILLEEQAKPAPRRGLLRRLRDAVLGPAYSPRAGSSRGRSLGRSSRR